MSGRFDDPFVQAHVGMVDLIGFSLRLSCHDKNNTFYHIIMSYTVRVQNHVHVYAHVRVCVCTLYMRVQTYTGSTTCTFRHCRKLMATVSRDSL